MRTCKRAQARLQVLVKSVLRANGFYSARFSNLVWKQVGNLDMCMGNFWVTPARLGNTRFSQGYQELF